MFVLWKQFVIILFITISLFLFTLVFAIKLFHLIDSTYPIDFLEGKFIDYDPYFYSEKSKLETFKKNRANGFVRESTWQGQYITNTGRIVYNVKYKLSELKSRTNLIKKIKSKHLIFAGDSQTFGVGVKDEEVFTNLLNKELKFFNSYNLGYPGWSPASTYALLKPENKVDLEGFIPNQEGMMVYLFYPYLSARDVGEISTITFTSGYLTYLTKEQEKLKSMGTFKDSDEFYINAKKFFSFFRLEELFRKAIKPLFVKLDPLNDYRMTTLIFSEMEKLYLNRFPKGMFYVAICDNFFVKDSEYDFPLIALRKSNLNLIDLRGYEVCNSLKYYYNDHHLSPDGHVKLAEAFKKELNLTID